MKNWTSSILTFVLVFVCMNAYAQQTQRPPAQPVQSAPIYQNAVYQQYPPQYYQQPVAYPAPQNGQMPQQPVQGAQPAPPPGYYYGASPMVMVTIHTGTPVELETIYPLNGKTLSQGQTIDLRVKYDVVVNGQRVISAGAPARAVVSSVETNKMFGKAGELQLLPQYVQMVDGQFLPVTGMPANFEGKNRKELAWGSVAAGALTGGVGFLALPFIKGKAVEVPVGTAVNCSVLGERTIAVAPMQR